MAGLKDAKVSPFSSSSRTVGLIVVADVRRGRPRYGLAVAQLLQGKTKIKTSDVFTLIGTAFKIYPIQRVSCTFLAICLLLARLFIARRFRSTSVPGFSKQRRRLVVFLLSLRLDVAAAPAC
jgi:hypothetical protein